MDFDGNLVRGTVEPLVLKLLSEEARYGYEIIKLINERTGGVFQWKEGTLYPCLHRMENAGLVKSMWKDGEGQRQRKYYAVTAKGKRELNTRTSEWREFSAAVQAILFGRAMA